MDTQIIVASTRVLMERVKARHIELGLNYPTTHEHQCDECGGECFVSEGTMEGAKKHAEKEGLVFKILCLACVKIDPEEDNELHIPKEQIAEFKNAFKKS